MPTTSAFTQNTWYCRHASTHRFCFSCVQGLVNCLLCHEKEEEEEGIVVGPALNAAAPASSKLPTSMTSIWWGFKEETEEAALGRNWKVILDFVFSLKSQTHSPPVNRARIRLCCGSLKYNTNVPASSLNGSAWYQAAATTTTTTEEGFANRLSANLLEFWLGREELPLDCTSEFGQFHELFSHSSNKLSLYTYLFTSIVAPPFAPPPAL